MPLTRENKITLAAISVTILLSGAGFVVGYINGLPSPSLAIVEIGFSGTKKTKEARVPPEAVKLSVISLSMPVLSNFERFEKLVKYDKSVSEEIERIKSFTNELEKWFRQYSNLNTSNILEHPFFSDEDPVAYMMSGFRSRVVSMPSVDIEELKARPRPLNLFEQDDPDGGKTITLRLPGRTVGMGWVGNDPAHFIKGVILYSYAIAALDYDILKHFSNETKKVLSLERSLLSDLQKAIRDALVPNSTFKIRAHVGNTGSSALILRPYFRLDILNEAFKGEKFLLEVQRPENLEIGTNTFELESGGFSIQIPDGSVEGSSVQVEEFFPSSQSSSYVVVQPNSTVTVVLVGTSPLKELASKFLDLMKSDALFCRLTALTLQGELISSGGFLFRNEYTVSVEAELLSEFQEGN